LKPLPITRAVALAMLACVLPALTGNGGPADGTGSSEPAKRVCRLDFQAPVAPSSPSCAAAKTGAARR